MKKIQSIIWVFFLVVAFVSCKKTSDVNLLDENSISAQTMGLLKQWYSQQQNTESNLGASPVSFISKKVDWEKAKYFQSEHYYIIPVGSKNAKKYLSFLSIETDNIGKIIKGIYKIVVPSSSNNIINTENINPAFLTGASLPNNFSGSVIEYNLKHTFISSKHFENGKLLSNRLDKILSKDESNVTNTFAESSTSGLCTNWYWVTYDIFTGEIYSSTYISTTCENSEEEDCTNCGGGGGGGGGTLENFINEGASVNDNTPPVITTTPDGDDWNLPYNWVIYTAGTWGLLSYENATAKKIHYANYSRWEFQTFTHGIITDFGVSVGGTRTYQDLGPTINISGTRQSAFVRIDFKVTHAIAGIQPVAIPYNANKIIYAP